MDASMGSEHGAVDRLDVALEALREKNSEVSETPVRRRFSTEYKLRILEEADQCNHGEQGALLRREGLFSSHLETWRRQRAQGQLEGVKRSRAESREIPWKRLLELERENRQLRQQLQKAETVITLQKKLSALLDLESKNS